MLYQNFHKNAVFDFVALYLIPETLAIFKRLFAVEIDVVIGSALIFSCLAVYTNNYQIPSPSFNEIEVRFQ